MERTDYISLSPHMPDCVTAKCPRDCGMAGRRGGGGGGGSGVNWRKLSGGGGEGRDLRGRRGARQSGSGRDGGEQAAEGGRLRRGL